MVGYIASNSISDIIKNICNESNIMILNGEVEELDFLQYIKQTKVNFNLIKQFIIDLNQIKNTDEEFINSIKAFQELYVNVRIIIVARGYDNQNFILTSLYENGFYNLINSNDEKQIQEQLKKCILGEGLEKKDVKQFKKIEEVKETKVDKLKQQFSKITKKVKIPKFKNKEIKQIDNKQTQLQQQQANSVYFFAILMEAVTRLVKFICYFAVFILTSIGMTFLFNVELREKVFQIFGLK